MVQLSNRDAWSAPKCSQGLQLVGPCCRYGVAYSSSLHALGSFDHPSHFILDQGEEKIQVRSCWLVVVRRPGIVRNDEALDDRALTHYSLQIPEIILNPRRHSAAYARGFRVGDLRRQGVVAVEGRDERGVPMQEPVSSRADTVAVETGEESVLGGGI